MNWMLWRFDREHLPAGFQPFTAAEIGRCATQPLRLEASQMRSDLLSKAECVREPPVTERAAGSATKSSLTTCPRDCYDSCGITVIKRDGAVTAVRGDPAIR